MREMKKMSGKKTSVKKRGMGKKTTVKKLGGMKTGVVKKGRGKKTEMKIHNFQEMMHKKFGGGKT